MHKITVLTQQQIATSLRESSESGSVHLTGSREERRQQFRAMRETERQREGARHDEDKDIARRILK